MSQNIGRNDPCPCGSGKKYKKCCLGVEGTTGAQEDQYRFEPGSYGDAGSFIPSIACLKQMPDGSWDYYFVLVNPEQQSLDEAQAAKRAEDDLKESFDTEVAEGRDLAPAMLLKSRGYVKVDDFRLAGA